MLCTFSPVLHHFQRRTLILVARVLLFLDHLYALSDSDSYIRVAPKEQLFVYRRIVHSLAGVFFGRRDDLPFLVLRLASPGPSRCSFVLCRPSQRCPTNKKTTSYILVPITFSPSPATHCVPSAMPLLRSFPPTKFPTQTSTV